MIKKFRCKVCTRWLLFEAVWLYKNADPDKYGYIGCMALDFLSVPVFQ